MKKVIAVKCKKDEVTNGGARILRAVPRNQVEANPAPEMVSVNSPLHDETVALCQRSNSIAGQMDYVMNLNDEDFDAEKAVGLYQRVAVLRSKALVLWQKAYDEGLKTAMTTSSAICGQAEQMLADLETRLAPDFAGD